MKKYLSKILLCTILATTVLSSCDLDQYPKSGVPADEAWTSVSDAENFYIGLLAAFRGVAGGGNAYVPEIQTDLFNITRNASSLNQEHKWTFTTNQFSGDIIWANNYTLVRYANDFINNSDRIPADEDERAYINTFKGVAYLARAYAYTNMVPRYCVNYENAEQAEKALGLPLVFTVDLNAKPARSSLEATYQQILSDLDTAESLIYDEGTEQEPGLNVLKAIRARVYLNMKRYDEAIEMAQELMDYYPLIEDESGFSTMWKNDTGSEIIFQPIQNVYERTNSYSAYISYDEGKTAYNPYFIPTQGLVNLYSTRDYRKSVYFKQANVATHNSTVQNVYIFNKYPGNTALLYSNEVTSSGQTLAFYNMTKAFRVAEFYLIAAEAELFKADPDEEAAKEYLNTLRSARGLSSSRDQIKSTGEELIKDMKEEWVREMVGEGFRLDCLKRWGDGFTRFTPQTRAASILSEDGGVQTLTIEPGNMRFIWEIPSQDLQANTSLIPNWK